MNYYEHHLGDWAAATGHLTWDEDMAYTRLLRAYYHTERPIPNGQQYRLAKASTPAQRRAVDQVLAEFFELVDGSYHQKRADAEIARYKAAEPERDAKKANEEARLKRHREERARLFQELAAAGQHAPWNISMNELRTLAKRCSQPLPATAPATPATATQEPVAKSQEPDPIEDPPASRAPPAASPRATKKAPKGLALTPELRAWAAEHTPHVADIDDEFAAMCDHTFTTARSDWEGTARNWLRKAEKDAVERKRRAATRVNGHANGHEEPEWRRIQRERNEAALGPFAAKRGATDTIDMEPPHGTASLLG